MTSGPFYGTTISPLRRWHGPSRRPKAAPAMSAKVFSRDERRRASTRKKEERKEGGRRRRRRRGKRPEGRAAKERAALLALLLGGGAVGLQRGDVCRMFEWFSSRGDVASCIPPGTKMLPSNTVLLTCAAAAMTMHGRGHPLNVTRFCGYEMRWDG